MSTEVAPDHDFARRAEPLRRELKLHCYRMLGSLHEAEDLVQETFLRAWRGRDGFDGRGSFRGWLYRIATNACLDARARPRRLPDRVAPPATGMPRGEPPPDLAWLEPFPDSELDGIPDAAPGPLARYELRESVRLAFVALIQHLPPRQRAALLLCDVFGWPAGEAAETLGTTIAAVNSALQRARATLAQRGGTAPAGDADATLLARYVAAWESLDLDGFVALLREDATYVMPPWPHWYRGRAAIRGFFAWAWPNYGGFRLLPTRANRQPAFAVYSRDAVGGPWLPHSLHMLDAGTAISALTVFVKPLGPGLFSAFGMAGELHGADEPDRHLP